jgi:hypothetical protein
MVLAAATATVVLAIDGHAQGEIIVASMITVVGPAGGMSAVLGRGDDQGSLEIRGKGRSLLALLWDRRAQKWINVSGGGSHMVGLACSDNGDCGLTFSRLRGGPRDPRLTVLAVNARNYSELSFYDKAGDTAGGLLLCESELPKRLLLGDRGGAVRVQLLLSKDDQGAALQVGSMRRESRLWTGYIQGRPVLAIHDAADRPIWDALSGKD